MNLIKQSLRVLFDRLYCIKKRTDKLVGQRKCFLHLCSMSCVGVAYHLIDAFSSKNTPYECTRKQLTKEVDQIEVHSAENKENLSSSAEKIECSHCSPLIYPMGCQQYSQHFLVI